MADLKSRLEKLKDKAKANKAIEKTRENFKQVKEVRVDKLKTNPFQPRIEMDEEELESLANSIREKGLLQPIVVTPDPKDDDSYIIIAGHRRSEAFKKLGKDKIKVNIIENIDEKDLATLALIENMQRQNLDVIEEAISLKNMLDNFYPTIKELAKVLGMSEYMIKLKLGMLKLPKEILTDIKENKTTTDVRALNLLNKVKNKEQQIRLYKDFLKYGRKWLEAEVNKQKSGRPKKELEIKFTKKGGTIKINKTLNDEQIKELKEFLEKLLKS